VDVGFVANVSQEPTASIFRVEEPIVWLHCGRYPEPTSADLDIEPELDS
jgi:hypothetical protein